MFTLKTNENTLFSNDRLFLKSAYKVNISIKVCSWHAIARTKQLKSFSYTQNLVYVFAAVEVLSKLGGLLLRWALPSNKMSKNWYRSGPPALPTNQRANLPLHRCQLHTLGGATMQIYDWFVSEESSVYQRRCDS